MRRSRPTGVAQRTERDAFATLYEDRLRALRGVEERLVFGRLDLRDDSVHHVGRIGLSDDDQRQLLLDWRASAAEDFYRATAAAPGPVVRRRHIATAERTVTSVEDELLDLAAVHDQAASDGPLRLNGEGALMAALGEHRTGRMRDIVSTIQAEQDRIIRAPISGVLVVQGGPGTGKTAVALHRAAYLLYTHRDRIARSGVLVVGPSPVFLRYIDAVLPALGETDVVMSTPGQLFPGVQATAVEAREAERLKGDLRMVKVLARAVSARQRVPDGPRRLRVESSTITLQPHAVEAARARARRSGRPHNAARVPFLTDLMNGLAGSLARAQRLPLDEDTRPDLLASLRDAPDVRRELNLCWLPLTPQRLLADLWADPAALAAAAPHLSRGERAALHRERGAPWTAADVPLLDEAAELLGEDDTASQAEARRATAERAEAVRYAREALASAGAPAALVSAEPPADRFAGGEASLTVAERAAGDRTWAFGHIVVDEAQELSPMAWRVLMRRCPSRSMTVVGDVAQTASAAGASAWSGVFDRYVQDRWRLEELTVNYRTPEPVMDLAAAVLAANGVTARTPQSARSGKPPSFLEVARVTGAVLAEEVRGLLADLGGGRVAVVGARSRQADLDDELRPLLTDLGVTAGVDVLDVGAVKGLEFDAVVLVEPAEVLAESPRGAGDLYVALTRPTQRLVVVHALPLPPGMPAG